MGPRGMRMGSSRNIVRVIKSKGWAGHVARMEEGRSAFKILTGKPTAKRPLGFRFSVSLFTYFIVNWK